MANAVACVNLNAINNQSVAKHLSKQTKFGILFINDDEAQEFATGNEKRARGGVSLAVHAKDIHFRVGAVICSRARKPTTQDKRNATAYRLRLNLGGTASNFALKFTTLGRFCCFKTKLPRKIPFYKILLQT